MRTRSPTEVLALLGLEVQEKRCLALIALLGTDAGTLTRVKEVLALQSTLKDIANFDLRTQRLAFLRQVVHVRPSLRPKFIFPEDKNGPLAIKSEAAKVLRAMVREYVELMLRGELEGFERDHEHGELILRLTVKDVIVRPNGEHRAELKRLTTAMLDAHKIEVSDVRVEIRGNVLDVTQVH